MSQSIFQRNYCSIFIILLTLGILLDRYLDSFGVRDLGVICGAVVACV